MLFTVYRCYCREYVTYEELFEGQKEHFLINLSINMLYPGFPF